jgi:drug/metabolite transporter (DMT)-like permease
MKTLIVLFISILAQILGNIYLTKGMKAIGEASTLSLDKLFNIGELFEIGVEVFTSPLVWLGIAGLIVFFLLYLVALSWSDLSFVLPVTAFGYALNAVMAWYLLGERISAVRGVGTLVICIGVAVVARTEQRTVAIKE